MSVQNDNRAFSSLAERILNSYISAYPRFRPVDCPASCESQADMHSFMRDALTKLYENPAGFGFETADDDFYRDGSLMNSRPELAKAMEKVENRFVVIVHSLIKLGRAGEVAGDGLVIHKSAATVSKSAGELLEKFGLSLERSKTETVLSCPKYPKMFAAWKAYSDASDDSGTKVDSAIAFIYGKYFGRVYSAADFFAGYLADVAPLEALEKTLSDEGFVCMNSLLNAKTRFACAKWSKDYKNGQKAYMSVSHNWRFANPLIIEFRLPDFRTMLDTKYDSLKPSLQSFVFKRLKTCDGCGYCVQTDKKGSREKLSRVLASGGESALKCPLFPNFTFREFDSSSIENMTELLKLCESLSI